MTAWSWQLESDLRESGDVEEPDDREEDPRKWKQGWRDSFIAGFRYAEKMNPDARKPFVTPEQAYKRGSHSKKWGLDFKAGYAAYIDHKRGAYAMKHVKDAKTLGLTESLSLTEDYRSDRFGTTKKLPAQLKKTASELFKVRVSLRRAHEALGEMGRDASGLSGIENIYGNAAIRHAHDIAYELDHSIGRVAEAYEDIARKIEKNAF